jgi:hypothetical protein
MPASMSVRMTFREEDAGPSVQTIFVQAKLVVDTRML